MKRIRLSFQIEEICTTVPVLSTTETFVFPVDPNHSIGWNLEFLHPKHCRGLNPKFVHPNHSRGCNPGFLHPKHCREEIPCYTTAAES
jgi:hypothetical protein